VQPELREKIDFLEIVVKNKLRIGKIDGNICKEQQD